MIGLLAWIACTCVALLALVPVFAGAPHRIVAAVFLVLGFIALDLLRVPTAPHRPLRVTLGIGALIALAMAASLFTQPVASDRVTAFQCGAIALGAMLALLTIVVRPRIAVALCAALALCGARILWRLLVASQLAADAGPSQTLAFTIAAASGAAFVTALWHARQLWRVGSVPQRAS